MNFRFVRQLPKWKMKFLSPALFILLFTASTISIPTWKKVFHKVEIYVRRKRWEGEKLMLKKPSNSPTHWFYAEYIFEVTALPWNGANWHQRCYLKSISTKLVECQNKMQIDLYSTTAFVYVWNLYWTCNEITGWKIVKIVLASSVQYH